jgi:L-fuconolactonase
VCLLDPHPEVLPNVFDRFPELRLVLDHCGYVHDAEQWDKVLRAASLPRLSMKWSHTARAIANIASREDQATAKSREFLRALDAYGVERIMWASDVTTQKESWHDLLGFVSHHPTLSQGDKEWVLGRTAREVFQWPRPVAANS